MLTKATKRLTINIAVLILICLMPLYILKVYRDNSTDIILFQKWVFATLLCGSIFLAYYNNRIKRTAEGKKWMWVVFEILGILGILYSVFALGLMFLFRHGIGF